VTNENYLKDDLGPEDEESAGRFPLLTEDVRKIEQIVDLIREHFAGMSPVDIHVAAAVLLALDRLPASTPGVQTTFGFIQPSMDGNYAWADIRINEDSFSLSLGEHFYTPEVGGDTESRIVFNTQSGTQRRAGDIGEWLEVASWIASTGRVSWDDYSAHDDIDWLDD
jgi:hypothetical protein